MSHKAFDEELLFWDEVDMSTVFTMALSPIVSSSIDLGQADADEADAGVVVLKFVGIGSAGSATVTVLIRDSADDSTFATVLTTEAYAYDADDLQDLRIALPKKNLRRYVRVELTIGTADLNAGDLTGGLVKP